MVVGSSNLTLQNDSFQGLNNLNYLSLMHNNISTIPIATFFSQTNLEKLKLSYNKIETLPKGSFRGLISLEWLFLNSNRLREFSFDNLMDMPKLQWLNLTDNWLTLEGDRFPRMEYIYDICLSFNAISSIDDEVFKQLDKLHLLGLNYNKITHIHARAFAGLQSIRDIQLMGNPLKSLSAETFARNNLLDALWLGHTSLTISSELLINVNLSYLNLNGIPFQNINFHAIAEITNLKYIVFEKFYFCSMALQVRNCKPNSDGVSSFQDLLTKPVLRYSTWIMACIILIGNLMVLWGRFIYRDENRGVTMVIRNLALSDILMGFYLFCIAIQDYRFRNQYHKLARDWISSWKCAAIGVLAVTSSEVSMLILAFMSLERFLLIAHPFRAHHRLNPKNIFISLLLIWLIGAGVAIAPAVFWRSSTMFYGTYSGTCFPLHMQEPYPLGWQYSAFIFLGMNFFLLMSIIVLYTALMVSICRTRKATPLSLLDCEFAVRFFFIVLTDVMCWAPIIVMKIWAFFRYHISDDTYGWLIIFILPLNSAVNPLLYTFTTPKYRKQILLRGWQKFTARKKMEASATGTGSNPDDTQSKGIPLLYNTTRTQST
ncbi:relaxin receptor 1 isoform X2 [Episyrphus balteatus]|nr:relaxin receptor 1 isoform X2 [Episyrphus balteatus]